MDAILIAATLWTSPLTLVKETMRLEMAAVETNADGPFSVEAVEALFTRAFNDALDAVEARERALNEPRIEGDLIVGHQEYCPLHNVTFGEPDDQAGAASVTVTFMSQWCFDEAAPEIRDEVTTVTFHLVQNDGLWMIDDLDNSLFGSLRVLLANLAAQ